MIQDAEFVPLGKRYLRGLVEDLELFAVVSRTTAEPRRRRIDPVCRMDLATGEAAATLSFPGEERVFCSQECRQRVVAAQERYGLQVSRP